MLSNRLKMDNVSEYIPKRGSLFPTSGVIREVPFADGDHRIDVAKQNREENEGKGNPKDRPREDKWINLVFATC